MGRLSGTFKYAVFNEWADDPPAGEVKLFYAASGEEWGSLTWPADEIREHLGYLVNEEDEASFREAFEALEKGTEQAVRRFSWDNGGAGCGVSFIAEGKDVAAAAAAFLEDELGIDDDEWDEEEAGEEKTVSAQALVDAALADPLSEEAVLALLEYIDDRIESRNGSMY